VRTNISSNPLSIGLSHLIYLDASYPGGDPSSDLATLVGEKKPSVTRPLVRHTAISAISAISPESQKVAQWKARWDLRVQTDAQECTQIHNAYPKQIACCTSM